MSNKKILHIRNCESASIIATDVNIMICNSTAEKYPVCRLESNKCHYHTSNSRYMGINGEAVYKKPYFFTTSHVTIHISITSRARIRIRYYKSRALRLNMQ